MRQVVSSGDIKDRIDPIGGTIGLSSEPISSKSAALIINLSVLVLSVMVIKMVV
jgi:hypothetical protein